MNKQFAHTMTKYGTFKGQWCPLKNKLAIIQEKVIYIYKMRFLLLYLQNNYKYNNKT